MSSNALSLLTSYGSDTSDDDVPGPRVSTKRTRKNSNDMPSNKKLPRPNLLLDMDNSNPEHLDDPSLHAGRIRTFSHERGNWATYIYIPFEECDGIEELMMAIMQIVPKHVELRKTEDFHLSLTKTVILKYHWIDSFVDGVKSRITPCKKFMILFNDLKVYCNEDRTRTFIGLCIRTGYDSLVHLVEIMNKCLAEFKLPPFYNDPSFHMSIAWCVGDFEEELNSILPQMNHRLHDLMDTSSQDNWTFFFPDPDRLSNIFLMKKETIVLAKNPQTSKRISLIQILYFQIKQQVFPNNIFEEETELEDHHRPTMIM
ncbi:hypothetical protein JTB14_033812 [Gonioctena quinquepunctata]|nr:hypothetical protein JTB14_033812 [Gonioctena quinquepunctata]